MGALEGSLSFRTFYVEGEPPKDFQESYLRRLQSHFFEPLSPAGEEDMSAGWVPVQDPLAEEFRHDHVFFNQYILFGLRIDKWSLPSAWIKAMMRRAVAERLPELEAAEALRQREDGKLRPRAKLSKRERDKIKLEVETEVKQKTLPSMKVIDAVWNISEGRLRLWSTSPLVCELFAEKFESTFDLSLHLDSPFMMARNLGLSESDLDAMVAAEPWHPLLSVSGGGAG